MRGRGRPRKTDGSPGAQKRRERDRTRKREQLERLALGQNRKQGRPRKQVAAEPTDLEQDAEVMKIPNGRPGAKRSKQLTCCRLPGALGHIKPLKPDGNPGSPGPATTSCKAVQASATVPAPVLQQQVADEELCLICMQGQLETLTGVLLPMYLPCCPGRMHTTCLATWRTISGLKNGQRMVNVHNCPGCNSHLMGTRDLRGTAPTSADMRKFHVQRDGVNSRRLDFGGGPKFFR